MNKVLIIDDDKELCALMKKCIEQEKLSAVTVYNGIEGVRLIDENKDSYWIILPVVLGLVSTMLMYDENQNDMLKQLWIIPISKTGYFFSKFIVVLSYSVCFMLLTAIASVFFGMLPGYITFEWNSISYLFKKCIEIAILTAFSILPLLAVAAAGKNYILPVCVTLVYTFLSFILLMVNMYLHPLSSATAIIMRDIPGVILAQEVNIPAALFCIGIWTIVSIVFAYISLKHRK